MKITQEDRLKILDDIATSLGFVERDADEFTAIEIAERFGGEACNVKKRLDKEGVKYTRRKAEANGRRQYVYRFNVIIEK